MLQTRPARLYIHSIFGLLLVLCTPSSLLAETAPLIQTIQQRTQWSLNGKWRYIVDRYEIGHGGPPIWQDATARDKSDRVEYSFADSPTLLVPGDWHSQDDKLFWYEGTIWYRRQFQVSPEAANKRLFIYFGAANYLSKVYLNGQPLGEHVGGFTPFNFEVTDVLREGTNTLVVGVSNTRLQDGVPGLETDWFNFGGITRDVRLVAVEPTFIRDYYLQLAKDSANQVSGWIQLDGNSMPEEATIVIDQLNVDKTFKVAGDGKVDITFEVENLTRWSPDNPKLYDVRISAGDAAVEDRIGFRTIQTRGMDILLNGEPIFLRGICMHEENPITGSRAWSVEDARRAVKWAREMNCNFMRLAHYPHNENMVRYAEQQGILLWEEVPLYWGIDWDNEDVYANAQHQMGELIGRDKNRANVIIWSICNETSPTASRNRFLNKLAAFVRSRDDTRLISAALQARSRTDEDGRRIRNLQYVDDPLGRTLDVVSLNEYIGWYGSTPDACAGMRFEIAYEKPLIISELGAGALYGFHADRQTRWTEEYQSWFYEENLKMIQKIPQLRGISPWILFDFQSPRRMLPLIQDGWNRKGVISERGDKKQAFFVMQNFYERKASEAQNKDDQ